MCTEFLGKEEVTFKSETWRHIGIRAVGSEEGNIPDSISYLCCVTNYPKTWWLKIVSFIISQFFVGQASGCSLAESSDSQCLKRFQSRCQPGLKSPSNGSVGGGDVLPI